MNQQLATEVVDGFTLVYTATEEISPESVHTMVKMSIHKDNIELGHSYVNPFYIKDLSEDEYVNFERKKWDLVAQAKMVTESWLEQE